MTYIEQLNAASEALIAGFIVAATDPLKAQLAQAQSDLVAAQSALSDANAASASAASDAASQILMLTNKVTDLQERLDAALTPPTLPTPPVKPSAGLWFKMPDDINTHDKKVFAHYFGPFPRSMDNKTPESADYYSTGYIAPNGESGKHAAYGGYLRDRPMYREPGASTWRYDDCVWDIQTAQAAGIDGFVFDLLGQSGSNWDNYIALRDAADKLNNGFKVIPMLDCNGATAAASPASAAASIAQFAGKNGSWYLPDGRYVISSFKMEGKTLDWWTQMIAALKALVKVDIAFLSASLNFGSAANYSSVTWGEGSWGDGDDPAIQKAQSNKAAQSHARGKVYMQPVGGQNVRPNQHVYDEAANTEAERASWERAIADGADYVQMVTWSDYSESTTFAPSEARGYAPLDLASWYITKFKTGDFPTILTDEIILSHRDSPIGVKPSGPQTQVMTHWNRGGPTPTTPRDTVEALTFLTAPATVTITVAGQATTYDAPAGMLAKTVPLGFGAISVSVLRDGAVVAKVDSPVSPVQVPVRDNPTYFWASSARGIGGQKAPYGP